MVLTEVEPVPRNDVQQKLDADVVARAKVVALKRGLYVSEYLSELLRPLVDRDYEAEMRKEGFVRADEKPKRKRGE